MSIADVARRPLPTGAIGAADSGTILRAAQAAREPQVGQRIWASDFAAAARFGGAVLL